MGDVGDSKLSALDEKQQKPSIMNFPWAGFEKGTKGKYPLGLLVANLINAGSRYTSLSCSLDVLENELKKGENNSQVYFNVNKLFELGAKKHGDRSHLKYQTKDIPLLVNALGRHILKGVDYVDEESGMLHRYHAIANIFMIRQILRVQNTYVEGETK